MSQRNSGYERKERDLYETPEWVTKVIIPHIPSDAVVWEPACASGHMAFPLKAKYASDLVTMYGESGVDFLTAKMPDDCTAIVTNPPFNKMAEAFIRRALTLTKDVKGFVAMLLPVDFDSAKTRRDIFSDCAAFSKKVVLTKRIMWFEGTSSPSANHAWFVWDWRHSGPAEIHYAFVEK